MFFKILKKMIFDVSERNQPTLLPYLWCRPGKPTLKNSDFFVLYELYRLDTKNNLSTVTINLFYSSVKCNVCQKNYKKNINPIMS
jgi:hypothetical protein